MEDVGTLLSELEAAKVPYQIEVYSGAPHGFTNFEGERYQMNKLNYFNIKYSSKNFFFLF